MTKEKIGDNIAKRNAEITASRQSREANVSATPATITSDNNGGGAFIIGLLWMLGAAIFIAIGQMQCGTILTRVPCEDEDYISAAFLGAIIGAVPAWAFGMLCQYLYRQTR